MPQAKPCQRAEWEGVLDAGDCRQVGRINFNSPRDLKYLAVAAAVAVALSARPLVVAAAPPKAATLFPCCCYSSGAGLGSYCALDSAILVLSLSQCLRLVPHSSSSSHVR